MCAQIAGTLATRHPSRLQIEAGILRASRGLHTYLVAYGSAMIERVAAAGLAIALLLSAAASTDVAAAALAADRAWDDALGWVALPRMASSAPQHRWTVEAGDDDDHAYALSRDVLVVAERDATTVSVQRIDLLTGEQMWSAASVGVGPLEVEIAPDGTTVFLTIGHPTESVTTTVIDAEVGTVLWSAGDALGAVALTPDLVMVGGGAYDRSTGAERWRHDVAYLRDGAVVYEDVPDATQGADDAGSFGLLDPITGRELWRQPRLHRLVDIWVINDTVVIAGGAVASAFDRQDGQPRWSVEFASLRRAHVSAISDELLLLAPGGGDAFSSAMVVDRASGAVQWHEPAGVFGALGFELGARPYVLSLENDDSYHVRDGETGETLRLNDSWSTGVAGGLLADESGAVVFRGLPGSVDRWSVRIADLERLFRPIAAGFVTREYDGNAVTFRGCLG